MGEAFVTPEWLTAIGTVATAVVAVAVAIGLQWWTSYREKSKAPRLTLERDESWFANEMGWPRLSLAVRNAPGKQAANDVQVSVEVITEGGGVVILPTEHDASVEQSLRQGDHATADEDSGGGAAGLSISDRSWTPAAREGSINPRSE